MRMHEEHTAGVTFASLRLMLEKRIAEILADIEPVQLREAVEYGSYNGKMVRPILAILSCAAVGGKQTSALDAAAAIEILHSASLLHDDIMDSSALRRGRPTVHVAFGVPMAILAGDTMIALAFQVMENLQGPNGRRVNAVFADSFKHVCEGQGFDICMAAAASSECHLSKVVEKKTAKLFQAASEIGALIGTRNETYIDAMRMYGYHLGMAFQIQDDLLDAFGNEHMMGKPARLDARNGKQTFATLTETLSTSGILSGNALPPSTRLLQEHTDAGCHALSLLPQSKKREVLSGLVRSLMNRER